MVKISPVSGVSGPAQNPRFILRIRPSRLSLVIMQCRLRQLGPGIVVNELHVVTPNPPSTPFVRYLHRYLGTKTPFPYRVSPNVQAFP
jgi:hypothetical protein